MGPLHSPFAALGPSTHLLKPGLMRDSPGIFLLAGKAEPAPLFFPGLGSASLRDRQDRDYKESASCSGSPANPSMPRVSAQQPSLAGPESTVSKEWTSLAFSPKGAGRYGPATASSLEEQRSLISSWMLPGNLPREAWHLA